MKIRDESKSERGASFSSKVPSRKLGFRLGTGVPTWNTKEADCSDHDSSVNFIMIEQLGLDL